MSVSAADITDPGAAINRDCQLNDGLVIWWMALPGRGAGGRIDDLCGRFPATLQNGASYTSHLRGDSVAALYAGSDDQADAGVLPRITSWPFSYAIWARPDNTSVFNSVLGVAWWGGGGGSTVYYRIDTNGTGASAKWRMTATNGTVTTGLGSVSLSAGRWDHLVGVYASDTSKILYVNGRREAEITTSLSYSTLADRFVIGLARPNPTDSFRGALTDARLWANRALTDDDVWAIYQDSLRGYPLTLRRRRSSRIYVPSGGGTVSLEGNSSSTSSGSATIRVTHTLSGTSASTSSGSATLAVTHRLTGTSDSTSGGSATVRVTHRLEGTSASTSGGAATISVGASTVYLEGNSSSTSSGAATIRVTQRLTGSSASTSGGAATVLMTHRLTGTSAATSGGAATLVISGQFLESGTLIRLPARRTLVQVDARSSLVRLPRRRTLISIRRQ